MVILDILDAKNWAPALTNVRTVLESVKALLSSPNPGDLLQGILANQENKQNKKNFTSRIIKETASLASDPVPGIECKPDESNMRHFRVKITGPKDSPYEGRSFDLELILPEDYPIAPPKVR